MTRRNSNQVAEQQPDTSIRGAGTEVRFAPCSSVMTSIQQLYVHAIRGVYPLAQCRLATDHEIFWGSVVKVRLFRLAIVASLFLTLVGQLVISPTTSAAASLHFLYGSGSQTGGKNIKLRVELTEPAPQGGVNVTMAVSNGAINVPPTIHVNTGETEKQVTVTTDPVMTNTDVTVSATLAGVTKSRDVLIKAPVLSSMGLQTVIRHGGVGKVIARISGPAPAGGFAVNTETDPSGHLDLDAVITIPAGETRLSLAVPASLFQDATEEIYFPTSQWMSRSARE